MKIKSISTGSAGKTAATVVAAIAFVIGVLRSLAWLIFGGRGRGPVFDDSVSGPLAFIFFPLFFGFVAFIVGFVLAVVYNTAAGITGGVDIEVDNDEVYMGKKGKEFDW